MSFERAIIKQLRPNVHLIDDAGESTCYLITGSEQALLVDTANGYEDLHEIVRSLTELLPHILLGNAIEIRRGDLASEVAAYMEENLSQRMVLETLCDEFFVSKNTLYRAFRERFGTTVNQYLTHLRMERAKRLLTDTEMAIAEVAIAVGIEDYHYFCRVFTRHAGIAPGAFRRHARG